MLLGIILESLSNLHRFLTVMSCKKLCRMLIFCKITFKGGEDFGVFYTVSCTFFDRWAKLLYAII